MASQTEPITIYDVPDYVGPLFFQGAQTGRAPFLSLAGLGIPDRFEGAYRRITGSTFPMSNIITANAAAQNVVTEDASLTTVTATSYAGEQANNYAEIHLLQYVLGWVRGDAGGMISGTALTGEPLAGIPAMATQRTAHLRQLACDLEFSALRGTAAPWSTAGSSGATGGLVTAVEAGSETAAGGAPLSTNLINTEIARMAAAGATFEKMAIGANAFQLQQLNALYSFAPQSFTVGGTQINMIYMPIAGGCMVVYDPMLATDDLVFIDMAHFTPCFMPHEGKSVHVSPVARTGAAEREQIYCVFGIDYSLIHYHGMISGLATS